MQQFLFPVSTVATSKARHNGPPFLTQKRQKCRGVLREKLGGDVGHASWNPYPISDQNLWFSVPYEAFQTPDRLLIYVFVDLKVHNIQ